MNSYVKLEEIAALGDFVKTSYTRDFSAIENRFPKLDGAFKTAFESKLNFIKVLESGLVLTEEQKGVTQRLYEEADELNVELNFLKSYVLDAGLNAKVVETVKADLLNGNIEGALLKLEGLKQFIVAHSAELIAEGMAADYATTLGDAIVSLTEKNALQNEILNNRKQLTDANAGHYDELMGMIKQICSKGKLVFKKTVVEDEYVMTKIVKRMRAGNIKK